MKINATTQIYLLAVLLFTMTFLFAKYLIAGFKTGEYNFYLLFSSLIVGISTIIQIIRLSKTENKKAGDE